jgi:hypothetical protein
MKKRVSTDDSFHHAFYSFFRQGKDDFALLGDKQFFFGQFGQVFIVI